MPEEQQDPKPTYQTKYDEFIKTYKTGVVTAENVGLVIAQMTQYYCESNLLYAKRLNNFCEVARANEASKDESGKILSSAKAKVMSEATEEAYALNFAKVHIENLEQILNSLKALQRGIMIEQGNVGNI